MAERLLAMKRVLKPTASIFLHCDPTASHYLKAVMDAIFEKNNFRNEIVWAYTGPGSPGMRQFNRKHDIIFWYNVGKEWVFNRDKVRIPHKALNTNKRGAMISDALTPEGRDEYLAKGKIPESWWPDISPVGRLKSERLGYPTQKPLALLDRIIKASSNPCDVILDPFCGCGTTVHAAEALGRQWIGVDISRFSTELMRQRILSNYPARVQPADIDIVGLPDSLRSAKDLARENPFEFEKWVCGRIGVNKMGKRKQPGDKGPDGGIDGEIILPVIRKGIVYEESVVVQVKGGHVRAEDVKALSETVRRVEAVAGVLVCFQEQMGTVENQRSRETWDGGFGNEYPVIQGYSVGDLLTDKPLNLPPQYGRKRSGRISA